MYINKPTSTGNSSIKQKQFKSKQYFKDNQLSGLYQEYHPKTGKLKQQGNFTNGQQTGRWRVIDQDGDQIYYQYSTVRVGALCNDGSTSSATGRGACSRHGGVAQWLYDTVKTKVGGTGKNIPLQQRVQQLKSKVKQKLKLNNKQGPQFQQAIFKILINLAQQNKQLSTQVTELQQQIQGQKIINQSLQMQINRQKKQYQQQSMSILSSKNNKSKQQQQQSSQKQKQKSQIKSNEIQPIQYGEEDQSLVFIKRRKKQQSQPLQKEQIAKKQPSQIINKQKAKIQLAKDQNSSEEYESDDDKNEKQTQLIKMLFQKISFK